jgi:hypothetical protein
MTSTEFDVFDRTGTRRTVILEEIPQSYTGVSSIQVTNRGAGFITNPTVTITGDGVGATATATIVNGGLDSITLTNRGSGYTRAVATLSGGDGGYGATAIVILDARFGNLRTIYFDDLAQRQVVQEDVGTIDYNLGIVADNFTNESLANKIKCLTKQNILDFKKNSEIASRYENAEKYNDFFLSHIKKLIG